MGPESILDPRRIFISHDNKMKVSLACLELAFLIAKVE